MSKLNETNWRFNSRTLRLGFFDGRLVFFFIPLLFMKNWWVFSLAVIATIVFWVVERFYHYPIESVLRRVNVWISGKYRTNLPPRKRTRTDR